MLVLLIGGARGGKSDLAVRLAERHGGAVTFIATAAAGDDEMAERIAAHRAQRPSAWQTVEAPLDLEEAITAVPPEHNVIVDCLTLWTANALDALDAQETELRAESAARAARAREALTVAITNEVGLGLVPDNPLGRSYRDLLGRVNAIWAAAADRTLLVVAGRTIELGPAPETLA